MVISETTVRPMDGAVEHPRMDLNNIYGPIRFARHSISILRRVHCTHIFGLLLRDTSGPDGYLLLLSLSSLRLHQSLCFRKVFSRSV
ncbi:hypothetical protein C8I07_00420 [Shewanella baltica]|nr:hypothetical protein C8I07_00420 [Shewanella baltica]